SGADSPRRGNAATLDLEPPPCGQRKMLRIAKRLQAAATRDRFLRSPRRKANLQVALLILRGQGSRERNSTFVHSCPRCATDGRKNPVARSAELFLLAPLLYRDAVLAFRSSLPIGNRIRKGADDPA